MIESTLNRYRPTLVTPPGATISDLLEEQGIRQNELATRMGVSPKFINELVAGKAAITPPTALALERALGTPANFWLTREAQFQESKARDVETAQLAESVEWLKELPLKEMRDFHWIAKRDTTTDYVSECLSFFGVANVEAWREQYVEKTIAGAAYRQSTTSTSKQGSIAAWLRAGERIGMHLACDDFDRDTFLEAVQSTRPLTCVKEAKDFLPELTKRFAACGVAIAIVRAPKHCPISGAVRWVSPNKALLQLSFKYLRNDSFWFTFFHECGHIALHGKKMLFLEYDKMESDEEREADRFAADRLIPPSDWASFAPLLVSDAVIIDFAKQVGIAPGIVLGRLQNEKRVPWSRLNHLKVTYKWVD